MQRRGSRPAVRSRRGVGLRAAMMAADGGAEEEAQHGAASFRGGVLASGSSGSGLGAFPAGRRTRMRRR